jgi:hypothetical protein
VVKKYKKENLTMATQETVQTNYYTVKQFAKEKGFLSENSLRFLIFHAETNGFHKVIKRIGRRILLSDSAFTNWLEDINKR